MSLANVTRRYGVTAAGVNAMNLIKFVPILMVVVFLASLAGTYQFYFRERLEEYAQNEQRLQRMEQKLDSLRDTFADEQGQPVEPTFVIQQWREAQEPWREALQARSALFTIGVDEEIASIPEGRTPRFFYEEKIEELVTDLQRYAQQNRVFLPDVTFGVPQREQLTGQSVTEENVQMWLERFAFGDAIARKMIDANASQIRHIEIWPPRTEYGLLEKRTVGLDFTMTMDQLVNFLDTVGRDQRYYNVDAIRVVNRHLRVPYAPPLEVQMLLTQARFLSEDEQRDAPAAAQPAQAGGFGGGQFADFRSLFGGPDDDDNGVPGGRGRGAQSESWWQRLWPF